MKDIKKIGLLLVSVLLISMLAIPMGISAENTTLTVSQERSAARVLPGDYTNVSFIISNPTMTQSFVSFEILDDEVPSGVTVNTETLGSTQAILNASGSTEYVLNITASENAPAGSFIVGLKIDDNKGYSDIFEVVTTVEAVYELELVGVSSPLVGDVNVGSWREYQIGVFNSGNIDDIYALSISDQQEIVDARFLNTTGNWTVLTHSTSGVHAVSDNIDAVNVSYGTVRYFYVDVEPAFEVEEDTQFIFNLTLSSVGSIEEAKLQVVTTVTDIDYDITLTLLSDIEQEVDVGGSVDYDFSVRGSVNITENITLNVLGNMWAVQNGWEYLLLDSNGSVVGGYYEPRAWNIIYEDLDERNKAWKNSPDVTSAGDLGGLDVGADTRDDDEEEWGITDESVTDSFGRYPMSTPSREWIYDPGIYEHPFVFELPANTSMQFTLRIVAPDDPENAPKGTQILSQVVGLVNENTGDRLGFATAGDHGFIGEEPTTSNIWWYILIVIVIIVVAIIIIALYVNTKKNYYYPGEGEKCGSGYKKSGDRCVKK